MLVSVIPFIHGTRPDMLIRLKSCSSRNLIPSTYSIRSVLSQIITPELFKDFMEFFEHFILLHPSIIIISK